MRLFRALRCWMLGCPGRVVSGWRGKTLMIGWCCNDCGRVKYYEPAASGYQRERAKYFDQLEKRP